jgi:hypothetical protein
LLFDTKSYEADEANEAMNAGYSGCEPSYLNCIACFVIRYTLEVLYRVKPESGKGG